jgi:GntR family transcriptional regulator, galactonate operon transcriptional repressor
LRKTPVANSRYAATRSKALASLSKRRMAVEENLFEEPSRVRNENDSLAAVLGGEIIAGKYPPGSILPRENVLLERFKVSRPTLREAYRALAAKGLIVSRQRVGTSVRPKSEWNTLGPDFLTWHLRTALTVDFVDNLFQLRQWVEPMAAFAAGASSDESARKRIAAAYSDMEQFKDGDGDLIGADLRFHQAILDATGNLFVGTLGGLIHTALVALFSLGWRGAVIKDDRLSQHRAVLEAIQARAPKKAQQEMVALLQDSLDDVRRSLAKIARSQASAEKRARPPGKAGQRLRAVS